MAEYFIHLAIMILIYGILAQSFNINFGLGRSFNLAHGACFALGAYTTALSSTDGYDSIMAVISNVVPILDSSTIFFIFCLIFSILVSATLALIIGAISIRLTTDYFAIGTLAFSSVVSALLTNWKSLTRGVLGIPGIPRPEVFGMSTQENLNFLLLLGIIFVVFQFFFLVFSRNIFSRRLRAQAEFESGALSLSVNAKLSRLWGFMIAASGAGVAGCFFAFYLQYIDPSSFSFLEMVFVLTICVVGRPGSFWGTLGATVFLFLLPEAVSQISWINERPAILGPMRQMMYAIILFVVLLLNKSRLFPSPREV